MLDSAFLAAHFRRTLENMPLAWPLVGRDEELCHIAVAMERVGATGLVVTGPAGVGKTRLVTEALAALIEQHSPTLGR